jgi:hypothetical protein
VSQSIVFCAITRSSSYRDHEDGQAAPSGLRRLAATGRGIARGIQREADPVHAGADAPHFGSVPADAAAEHDGISASWTARGAEAICEPGAEDVHCQPRSGVLPLVREQVPHVLAPAGEPEQPGALVEPPLDLLNGHVLRAREVADEGGIDVA